MAKKTLVIEITERVIRVCEISPKDKGFALGGKLTLPMPEGLVTDGQINDAEGLAAHIKQGLEAAKIPARSVVFNITSGRVAVREVAIPLVKDNKIRSIITTNASEYFPVDLSSYHVSHTVLGPVEDETRRQLRVMVYATPLALVEGYFKLAEFMGAKVQSIDYSGSSQYTAVKNLGGQQMTMFVSVDAATTYISFMKNGVLALQRTLTFGGDELVGDYLRASGREISDYLGALAELSDPGRTGRLASVMDQGAVQNSLERLVSGINRSLGYFNANNHENPVEKIVLYGMCGHLAYLKKAVGEACGLPTQYLEELEEAERLLPGFGENGQYIGAVGSCIRPLDILPAQFLNQRKQRKAERKQTIIPGVACFVLLAALSGALYFFAYSDNQAAKDEKARIESSIAQLAPVEQLYSQYQAYVESAGQFVSLRQANESPNDQLVAFFGELEVKMPSRLILMSASCTRQGVVLNITVPTMEDAAAVMVQLRTFQSLGNLRLASITENQDETGLSYINFSVSCEYGINPYFPAESAKEGA